MKKLPLVVDKLDDVPEAARAFYVEKDGKHHLAAEVEDPAELKESLEEERRLREAAERATRKATEQLTKLQNDQKGGKAGLKADELEQLRKDIRAEVEAEYAPRLAKAEKVEAENRTLRLDVAWKHMAAESGFLPEKLDDLWKLHGHEYDLTDDGKPMVKGKPGQDPKKHIEALKAKRPEWVQGTQASGGGAGGATKGGGAAPAGIDVLKNPSEALRAARAAGVTE